MLSRAQSSIPLRKILTPRQLEVLQLRAAGLTQSQVAERLNTSRENISIIEHRAHANVRAAKATLATVEQLSNSKQLKLPSGTSVFEAVTLILLRADVLRIKLVMNADLILAAIRSQCKAKIRGHHLTAAVNIRLQDDGTLSIR